VYYHYDYEKNPCYIEFCVSFLLVHRLLPNLTRRVYLGWI